MEPTGPKESTVHLGRFSFLESRQAQLECLADSVPMVRRESSDYQLSTIPLATLAPPESKALRESAERWETSAYRASQARQAYRAGMVEWALPVIPVCHRQISVTPGLRTLMSHYSAPASRSAPALHLAFAAGCLQHCRRLYRSPGCQVCPTHRKPNLLIFQPPLRLCS